MTHYLSKSKILSGHQCLRRIWLEMHQPELAVENPGQKRRMAVGQAVGEIAWGLMPDGKLITLDDGFQAAITETSNVLANDAATPLYEATLQHEGVLVRADLLQQTDQGLRVIEVKSSTSVKDYHLLDVATQCWVIEGAGHSVDRLEVAVIDNSFEYQGNEDYSGLLRTEDVTARVRELIPDIPSLAMLISECLNQTEPDISPGPHCSKPFDCPFKAHCNTGNSPEYPLTCLPYIGRAKKLMNDLKEQGYEDIRDIPEGFLPDGNKERVRRITTAGQPELLPGAKETLDALLYPRYYLDFETIAFAVPIWAGTRPYEQLPFQWSCHVQQEDGTLTHQEFLDITGEPPMRGFAESLIGACDTEGPIIVYNQTFEKGIIEKTAERFPDLATPLLTLNDRIFDLLPVAKANYYHPAQKGSWSIKKVLPCVVPELDYDQLEGVHGGLEAQEGYLEAISAECPPENKAALDIQLLQYCKMDTLAMVEIVNKWTSN